jgi:hypothetical protein
MIQPAVLNNGFNPLWTLTAVRGVDTMCNLDEVFKYLRKKAKSECKCGNNSFVAEVFHDPGCPYIAISEKAYSDIWNGTFKIEEPKKEIIHASEKVTIEESASETGLAADDFSLTPG